MSLQARLVAERGEFTLDVDLAADDGETLAIVGPSGAGKTTLLRAIAGLDDVAAGRVVLGDRVLDDTTAGVHLAAEHRGIGYVAQAPLLFPHLSALDNVAFGLRARGGSEQRSKRDARDQAGAWIDRVGLTARRRARPHELSGGEARRVALARALAASPRLLLLDEPLTGLDPARRDAMRALVWSEMAAFHGPRLLVTHDPLEAMGLATRIAVIEDGRAVQLATPDGIARQPRSVFAAEVVGVNVFRGMATRNVIALDGGGEITVADVDDRVAAGSAHPAVVVVHPRAVVLHLSRPEGSARNAWPARVTQLELVDHRVRVTVQGVVDLVAEVTGGAVSDLGLRPGLDLWASVKATEVTVLPGGQPVSGSGTEEGAGERAS